MNSHDQFTDDVGAYLLGALDPAEERSFEQHLEGCEECRLEVMRLEVARDALPRAVDQVAPPERLKQSLMATVRAEAPAAEVERAEAVAPPGRLRDAVASGRPRRSRWRELLLARPAFAAAAAALLIAVGIGLGALVGAVGGGSGDDASTVAATVDVTRMPAGKASLVLPDSKDGAILRVEGMQQPQAGHVYEVWVQRDGKMLPSSLFTVDSDGNGTAGIPDELRDAEAVLVTREPTGGSKQPSEPPVVTVPLPS
jgi:anti-sigma-K factor RskA